MVFPFYKTFSHIKELGHKRTKNTRPGLDRHGVSAFTTEHGVSFVKTLRRERSEDKALAASITQVVRFRTHGKTQVSYYV